MNKIKFVDNINQPIGSKNDITEIHYNEIECQYSGIKTNFHNDRITHIFNFIFDNKEKTEYEVELATESDIKLNLPDLEKDLSDFTKEFFINADKNKKELSQMIFPILITKYINKIKNMDVEIIETDVYKKD